VTCWAARPTGFDAAAEQAWNECALGHPVLAPAWRLWRYREPAVVLGCSQRRCLDAPARALPPGESTEVTLRDGRSGVGGLEVLVRRSGGGAVLVGPWMLGLSAVLPVAHPLVAGGPVASYRWLGEAVALALRRIGVDAAALTPQALRERRGDGAAACAGWACFGGLSPWEVLARGRKIAGLAQQRRRHGVLLVAGVLLQRPPWALLCTRLQQPPADEKRLDLACTDCMQELSRAELPQLEDALCQTLHAAVDMALAA
jgi:lipoate-protein ligase A